MGNGHGYRLCPSYGLLVRSFGIVRELGIGAWFPISGITTGGDGPMKRTIGPIARPGDITVLDRVVMNVIHMPLPIGFVPQVMLPEASLPDAPFPLCALRGPDAAHRDTGGEFAFDDHPSGGEIRIPLRQAPDGVQMIGQHHNGIDGKGLSRHAEPECVPQSLDMIDQQGLSPFGDDREKIPRTGLIETSIVHIDLSIVSERGHDAFRRMGKAQRAHQGLAMVQVMGTAIAFAHPTATADQVFGV